MATAKTSRIPATSGSMSSRLAGALLAAVVGLAGCSKVGGIDTTGISPISNDDAVATLSYVWNGARDAIAGAQESPKSTFSIPVKLQGACSGGGTRNYNGTISGTNVNGAGTANVNITATLAKCGYDRTTTITVIDAATVTFTGTIAVSSDAYAATSITLTAATVTVNGTSCPGGISMVLNAATPGASPVASGDICGRSGSIVVP